jgi:hypothetical protein
MSGGPPPADRDEEERRRTRRRGLLGLLLLVPLLVALTFAGTIERSIRTDGTVRDGVYAGIAIVGLYVICLVGGLLWHRFGSSEAEGTPPEPKEGIRRWMP